MKLSNECKFDFNNNIVVILKLDIKYDIEFKIASLFI